MSIPSREGEAKRNSMAAPHDTQRAAAIDESTQLIDAVRAATNGQDWARETVSAHCLPQLTTFAQSRGAVDPEGIAATVLIEFFSRLHQLDFAGPSHVWSYLYRITRSRIIDERRATKPVELREQASIEALVPTVSGPEEAVADRHYVDGLLASLTSEQRQVLEMRFLDDLSIEETANRTGRTLTAVKGLQRRALRSLTAAALLSILAIVGLALVLTGGDQKIPIASEGPGPATDPDLGPTEGDGELGDPDDTGSDDPSGLNVVIPDDETEAGGDDRSEAGPGDPLGPVQPATSLTGPQTAGLDWSSARFQFSAAEGEPGIDGFECALDGAPFEPCTSPHPIHGLAEGGHLFEVRAVDGAGNAALAPTHRFWVVERPPGIPAGIDLQAMRASTEELHCAGLVGTWAELTEAGYDVLVGTDGDDQIDVSGGDRPDLVLGLDGNDTIITGPGDDLVCSGVGNDSIDTGEGNDQIVASAGNDTVVGGPGDDSIWAGGGNDTVTGNGGSDKLHGQEGTDQLDGSWGIDQLYGGPGFDVLIGGQGPDRCHAGSMPPPARPSAPTTTSTVQPGPPTTTVPDSMTGCEQTVRD